MVIVFDLWSVPRPLPRPRRPSPPRPPWHALRCKALPQPIHHPNYARAGRRAPNKLSPLLYVIETPSCNGNPLPTIKSHPMYVGCMRAAQLPVSVSQPSPWVHGGNFYL
eukprot:scaffold174351_cov29-Tisochrysis_lutea.AAC.8